MLICNEQLEDVMKYSEAALCLIEGGQICHRVVSVLYSLKQGGSLEFDLKLVVSPLTKWIGETYPRLNDECFCACLAVACGLDIKAEFHEVNRVLVDISAQTKSLLKAGNFLPEHYTLLRFVQRLDVLGEDEMAGTIC